MPARVKRIQFQCKYCHCDFYTCGSKYNAVYCSKPCMYKDFRTRYLGAENPHWRGGKVTICDGRCAIYAPDHPGAVLSNGTYILEYRLIAEKKLGRPLLSDEIVHHIDGDVTNNEPDNLEVMSQSKHASLHIKRDPITGRIIGRE